MHQLIKSRKNYTSDPKPNIYRGADNPCYQFFCRLKCSASASGMLLRAVVLGSGGGGQTTSKTPLISAQNFRLKKDNAHCPKHLCLITSAHDQTKFNWANKKPQNHASKTYSKSRINLSKSRSALFALKITSSKRILIN